MDNSEEKSMMNITDRTVGRFPTDKKHGTKQAVRAVVQAFEKYYDPDSGDVVYITDGDSEESAEAVHQALREAFPDAVIRRIGLSPIIGAQTGPGALTLDFIGK